MSIYEDPISPSHVRVSVVHDKKDLFMDVPVHCITRTLEDFVQDHGRVTMPRALALMASSFSNRDAYTAASAALALFVSTSPTEFPMSNQETLEVMLAGGGSALLEVTLIDGDWRQSVVPIPRWPMKHKLSVH